MRLIFIFITFFIPATAWAVFFDRPDYFDNKTIYDEVEQIIDIMYDDSMSEKDRELRLIFRDKALVPTFKALKVENEKLLASSLRTSLKVSDKEIEDLMKTRPVIDGLKLTLENDFLAGTDRYYTNGLRVELSFNNEKFEEFFKKLGFDHSDFFLFCQQDIYNTSRNNITTDRPNQPQNAGYLFCGSAVNSYKMDKTHARIRSMQRLEAQLGTVGRGSYAEQVQNGLHHIIKDKEVNWDYQVGDKFFIAVNFQKYVKIGEGDLYGDSKPEYNVIVNAGGSAGSVTNYANAGVMLNYRLLGTLIDMYAGNKMTPSRIEQLSMMSYENRIKSLICDSDWSLNLYVGAEGKFVLNNYRIDGSDSTTIDTAPFVFDLKAGAVVRYKSVMFDVGIVRRSSEWGSNCGQPGGMPHTYGSASFTVGYDGYRQLWNGAVHPIRWIVDPEYRKKVTEETQFRKQLRRDGVTISYPSDDPKIPAKTMHVTCH